MYQIIESDNADLKEEIEILQESESRLLKENSLLKRKNSVVVEKNTFFKNVVDCSLEKDKQVMESLISLKTNYNSVLLFFIKLKQVDNQTSFWLYIYIRFPSL